MSAWCPTAVLLLTAAWPRTRATACTSLRQTPASCRRVTARDARRRRIPASLASQSAPPPRQEPPDWERTITGPRMEAGLDVHRRVHSLAAKHAAYQFQWRAFCERQQRSWQDARTPEDEAVIAVFHYECEQGIAKFEADVARGRESEWPARSLHPTQGLPALAAALRAASEATVGRARLFK